jgi:hypothetical protein
VPREKLIGNTIYQKVGGITKAYNTSEMDAATYFVVHNGCKAVRRISLDDCDFYGRDSIDHA